MTREEELKELQELEELAQLEALQAQEEAANEMAFQQEMTTGASQVLNQEAPMPTPESAEKLKAAAAGALQGFPFAKDIYSGAGAVKEALTDPNVDFSIESISKSYHKNMNDVNRDLKAMEEKYPGYFTAGEIASGAAIIASAPVLGTTITGVGALGAMYGLSKSEERTAEDALAGAASAVVFDRLGVFSARTMGKMAGKISNFADETFKTAVGAINPSSLKRVSAHLQRTGQSAASFADNLATLELVETGANNSVLRREPLISAFSSAEEVLDKAKILKQERGQAIGTILSTIDDVHGKDAVIKPQDMASKIKSGLINGLLESDNPDSQLLGQKLSSYVKDMLMYPEEKIINEGGQQTIETVWKWKEDFSLKRTHELAKDISEFVQNEYSKIPGMSSEASMLAQKKNVDGIIRGMIDDKVSSFVSVPGMKEGVSDAALNVFKQAKLDFSNLSLVEELMTSQVATKNEGVMGQLKNLFGIKGFVIGGALAGATGLDTASAFAVGATINQFLTSSRTPSAMAVGLRKLSEGLAKTPDPEVLRKIMVATSLGMDDFRDAMAFGIAKYEVLGNPIRRNMADIEKRQDVLYQLIRNEDKQLAEDFTTIMDTKEPQLIGEFLESLESHPKAKKYIEPGIGFDGKVYSEAAKQMQIKSIDRANLPLGQALRLKEQVRSQGLIPDLTPQPKQPTQWNKRDKSKPKY